MSKRKVLKGFKFSQKSHKKLNETNRSEQQKPMQIYIAKQIQILLYTYVRGTELSHKIHLLIIMLMNNR